MKIVWLVLWLTSIIWAGDSCSQDVKHKLERQYAKSLQEYTLMKYGKKCQLIKGTKNKVIVLIYAESETEEEDRTFKKIIAVFNKKSQKIKEHTLFTYIKNREAYVEDIRIDTKGLKKFSAEDVFSINISYFESHHTIYIHDSSFEIFETNQQKINRLLFKEENYTEQIFENKIITSTIFSELDKKNLEYHAPLFFNRYYSFSHLKRGAEGKLKNWNVELDESAKYIYQEGKYILKKKIYKDIFDLDQIELNSKKGLKYKEIVLRAMLYQIEITKNTVAQYERISNNLKNAGHKSEARFLESKIQEYNPTFKLGKTNSEKELETEVTNVTCGTGGCVMYTQRIGSIEKISDNTRRASYKIEKYIEDKFQHKNKIFIYAKCHKLKNHELSFDSPNDYKTVGTEWRYDFTRQNQKIAFDLCKEFSTPKFEYYLSFESYTTPNKPLIQKNFGRLYRTLLKKAIKEKKPEFAGKYIIAQWGCDEGKNECTTGGIIDASTGKATEFPFKYYAHNGSKEIIYKLNSSLIIFAGDFEFEDGHTEKNRVLFYELKDGEFLFLKGKGYGK